MSIATDFMRRHWSVRLFIIAIPAAGLAVCINYLAGGADGHEPPTHEPTGIEAIDLCPSMAHRWDRITYAADDYTLRTDCYIPPIRLAECSAPPAVGHLQVRACTDIVSGYEAGCPEGHVDNVGIRRSLRAGVAYWQDRDRLYTPHHILGHAIGLSHTTAATSWMHPIAGPSSALVRCEGAE